MSYISDCFSVISEYYQKIYRRLPGVCLFCEVRLSLQGDYHLAIAKIAFLGVSLKKGIFGVFGILAIFGHFLEKPIFSLFPGKLIFGYFGRSAVFGHFWHFGVFWHFPGFGHFYSFW